MATFHVPGFYGKRSIYILEVSSSELGRAVIDLPTIEALSLSDPPPLAPQIPEEFDDEYPAYSYFSVLYFVSNFSNKK